MDSVILFSIGCRKCEILKSKLDDAGVKYSVNSSRDEMIAMGLDQLPVLFVDGTLMDFGEAVRWIKRMGEN